MASIFKPTYTKPIPDSAKIVRRGGQRFAKFRSARGQIVTAPLTRKGDRIRLDSETYRIEYRDADGKTKRKKGYTDLKATEQLAAELERDAEHVRSGYKPKEHEHLARALKWHLEDYRASLVDKGTSEQQARQVHNRVKRLLGACRFTLWSDIDATKVQRQLADWREGPKGKRGMSAQTSNWYLQAIKGFCAWLDRERRAPENPVAHLGGVNVRTDRRHDRRAVTEDECRALLAAAVAGPEHFGMPGPDRALLYRTALESGLRAGELRTLTCGNCLLDDDPPRLIVKAAYSKHRQDDEQPIPAGLAAALRAHIAGRTPASAVFDTLPSKDKIVRMLRKDLTAAGIPYEDGAGRFADFHALRHTYISNLARAGVHPKVAMDLARHGNINLTMARYSHTVVADRAAVLSDLPDLTEQSEQRQTARATGTYGKRTDDGHGTAGSCKRDCKQAGKTTQETGAKADTSAASRFAKPLRGYTPPPRVRIPPSPPVRARLCRTAPIGRLDAVFGILAIRRSAVSRLTSCDRSGRFGKVSCCRICCHLSARLVGRPRRSQRFALRGIGFDRGQRVKRLTPIHYFDMRVSPEGQRRRRVPGQVLGHLDVHTGLDQSRDEGMPEGVKVCFAPRPILILNARRRQVRP